MPPGRYLMDPGEVDPSPQSIVTVSVSLTPGSVKVKMGRETPSSVIGTDVGGLTIEGGTLRTERVNVCPTDAPSLSMIVRLEGMEAGPFSKTREVGKVTVLWRDPVGEREAWIVLELSPKVTNS